MYELTHEIVTIKQVNEDGYIYFYDWTHQHNSGEKSNIRSSTITRKCMQKGTGQSKSNFGENQ